MTKDLKQNPKKLPWNKCRLNGPKPPLKPKQIWGIRTRLQITKRTRDMALFDLALDSKLRGCDLVRVKISDIAVHGAVQTRATVTQRKTGRPVQFELTEQTRTSVQGWLRIRGNRSPEFLFPSRLDLSRHLSTRQYARLVDEWTSLIGLVHGLRLGRGRRLCGGREHHPRQCEPPEQRPRR